jgi:hypothetical protein
MLKGNSSKKSWLSQSHWHRGSRFWRFPNRISQRIRSHMQKTALARESGPWGVGDWWKKQGSKISWHCPFKYYMVHHKYMHSNLRCCRPIGGLAGTGIYEEAFIRYLLGRYKYKVLKMPNYIALWLRNQKPSWVRSQCLAIFHRKL